MVMRPLPTVLALAALAATAAPAHAADPLRAQQWYLDAIHADAAHRVTDGRGVTVAVVDTGVDAAHPDLAGRIDTGPDFVDSTGADHDPNGHGTNLAGIITSVAGNGIGVEGAAPGARVLSIRVLGKDQSGTTVDEADGIDAAVKAGAQVINLSLGPSPDVVRALDPLDPLAAAINRATAAGVVVVAAAGNYGLPLCAQPVAAQGILCVAAVNRDGKRTDYSDYGVRVDVVAPGGDEGDGGVVSTAPGGGYAAMAGTSQATPQVAAEAALLVSLGLTGGQVVDRIKQTTRDLGAPGTDFEYGAGLVDMAAAVEGFAPTLEPEASPAAAAASAPLSARAPSGARTKKVLRDGLRVRVRSSSAGRCSARLTLPGSAVVARGSRKLPRAERVTLVLRATSSGRRALRRVKRATGRLTVTCPGGRFATSVSLRR